MTKKFPRELATYREPPKYLVFEETPAQVERLLVAALEEDIRLLPVLMNHYGIASDNPAHDRPALLGLVLALARDFVPAFKYGNKQGRPDKFLEHARLVGLVEHVRDFEGGGLIGALTWLDEERYIKANTSKGSEGWPEPIDALRKRYKDAMKFLRKEMRTNDEGIKLMCKDWIGSKLPWDENSEDI